LLLSVFKGAFLAAALRGAAFAFATFGLALVLEGLAFGFAFALAGLDLAFALAGLAFGFAFVLAGLDLAFVLAGFAFAFLFFAVDFFAVLRAMVASQT
jgi:hypothetical protein